MRLACARRDLDRPAVQYDSLMPAGPSRVSPFGRHVRRWRGIRRMSQLDLAIAAGTTARHLSFVETGRSRPGKDLILRIADALRVPLPERNTLLAAAGLPPAYPAHDLEPRRWSQSTGCWRRCCAATSRTW